MPDGIFFGTQYGLVDRKMVPELNYLGNLGLDNFWQITTAQPVVNLHVCSVQRTRLAYLKGRPSKD